MISKDALKGLLSSRCEKEWLAFQEDGCGEDELGALVSAMSNSAACRGKDKACLVWGVRDRTREIVGTAFDPDGNVRGGEPLKRYLNRKLTPDVLLGFSEFEIEDKRLVVLEVAPAKNIPTAFDGERYIRIGSSKERLSRYPEKEIRLFNVLSRGYPTIENTRSQYQDLSFNKLFGYYGSRGIVLEKGSFKRDLGLLTSDGEYNLLAQLLSDDSHIPMRVAIFAGETKASDLLAVREFGRTCLLYSLDDILRYGDVLNILQADEENRVVERKEVPLFNRDAFREAVVNAVLHNRWVDGNEPMFSVFSNRMEILSRGPLPPNQTMEGFFQGESVPVNEKLSQIFLQLRLSERTGRGVPKIAEAYGRGAFEFRENSILVRIPFQWIGKIGKSKGDSSPLTANRRRILAEIGKDGGVTKERLAALVGLGKTSIDNNIAYLRRNGYIERVGSNKTGSWRLLWRARSGI